MQTYQNYDHLCKQLIPELKVLYPATRTLSVARSLRMTVDSMRVDTTTLAVMTFSRSVSQGERQKISNWLKARLQTDRLQLIVEQER